MQKSLTDKYCSANLVLKEKEELGALLIGDCTSAVDKHVLKPHKIQTVLTIGQDSAPEKKQEGINYILYNVLDNKSQKISDMFDQVFEQIEEGRKIGGVLVHCYTGISRSASFVIAYLMRKRFISYDDAKSFVKKQRSVAHPNDNFHRQLQAYWKVLEKREQDRLKQLAEREKKQKQTETSLVTNISQILPSNISGISKRTFRGVKGAVRSAFRQQQSPDSKSIIMQPNQKSEKKEVASIQKTDIKKQRQEMGSIEKGENKKKKVESVYGNKTQVF